MIPTYVESHPEKGELRIGWASWDEGYKHRSVKWAYLDGSGKISRGSPELPFNILVDMVLLAYRKGELSAEEVKRLRKALAA